MLRSEHAIAEIDHQRQTIDPDRLLRRRDAIYLPAINEAIAIYRSGRGQARQDLHRAVEEILSLIPGCPPKRIAAFCKLLDNASTYPSQAAAAARLRRRVFARAAAWHPVVQTAEGMFDHDLATVRQQLSLSYDASWEDLADRMFADVIELQRLEDFEHKLTAADLLTRYNLAQAQAALYRASEVRIEAAGHYKAILRAAKLAGLMHRLTPRRDAGGTLLGYQFDFDGPATTLRQTTRYGVGFAALLSTLVTCDRWRMTANIVTPHHEHLRLTIRSTDGLRSDVGPPPDYDSQLEQTVADRWQQDPIAGWTLHRETELLTIGQTVYTPDFILEHSSGPKIYIELIGFWTPEYLADKAERLQRFRDRINSTDRWLLMFDRSSIADRLAEIESLDLPTIVINKRTPTQEWIEAVGEMGVQIE